MKKMTLILMGFVLANGVEAAVYNPFQAPKQEIASSGKVIARTVAKPRIVENHPSFVGDWQKTLESKIKILGLFKSQVWLQVEGYGSSLNLKNGEILMLDGNRLKVVIQRPEEGRPFLQLMYQVPDSYAEREVMVFSREVSRDSFTDTKAQVPQAGTVTPSPVAPVSPIKSQGVPDMLQPNTLIDTSTSQDISTAPKIQVK